MSATYNWSLRPGIPNKYNIQIENTTDDIKPTSYAYVALFGNDITGNGSRLYPYRTLRVGEEHGQLLIASGVYREGVAFSGYADGDVIIDSSFLIVDGGGAHYGISHRDNGIFWNTSSFGCTYITQVSGQAYHDQMYSSLYVFQNSGGGVYSRRGNTPLISQPGSQNGVGFNTFVNGLMSFTNNNYNGPNAPQGDFYFSIFENCNITIYGNSYIDYSLFHNCKFKYDTDNDYTPIDDLQSLLDFVSSHGFSNPGFTHCIFDDPLFNNPSIGDYTLSYNSPARNASYIGSFIGAHSIGYSIKASATASQSGFDQSTSVNLTVSDDSIILTDITQNGQIDSVVVPNLVQREISKFPSYGFMADRNGQYIDSISDLGTQSIAAGVILSHPTSYIVESGSILYNGDSIQPGDRFTTATSSTTFSTTANGTIREILEAPQRHTIMARFSNGDLNPLDDTSTLVEENWYYVSTGSINYNTFTYSAGDLFKVYGSSPSVVNFTGSGIVMLAMDNSLPYQHYEPGIKPTSNNVGDVRTGDIIRGNGDPNYVRGVLNVTEFPVNAKFVQIRYQIKVNNLKP